MSLPKGRSAGVLIPLFSLRGDDGWGVGELPDVGAIAPWMAEAGLDLLMMLPLVEAAIGQDSPYAALSAFALDPVYVSIPHLAEFAELGGMEALSEDERAQLAFVRKSPTVAWREVRELKGAWLWRCFQAFREKPEPEALRRFRDEQAHWLPDYTLFRALKEAHALDWWKGWEPELRRRDPQALALARQQHEEVCSFFEYVQWNAYGQLARARAEALRHGVRLAGDLPFMVAEDSADVWQRQDEFDLDATVGVPPDAFSADGQDWGLPVYRWNVIRERDYDWLRERGRRSAQLFDLVRIDHVVGFYRTYARPRDGSEPWFIPGDEDAQRRQGEEVMEAFRSAGVALVAEDLGVVPPWVREDLTRIGVPGYRVLRWEKDGDVFRDPDAWPPLSLATTGTHDTEPMAVWWDELSDEERRACLRLPALRHLAEDEARAFSPAVHAALLEAVYRSGSDLLVLPVQDLFGSRERVNYPGTVSPSNWSYRMPWSISELRSDPFVRARTAALRELADRHGRVARPG